MRVLIADHEHMSRLLVRRTFEKLGHECVQAEDGVLAWDLFLESRPNLILSAMGVSKRDGVELCKSVRNHSQSQQRFTYFMMLVEPADKPRLEEAARAGIDDFITTPIDSVELEARIVLAQKVISLQHQTRDLTRQIEQNNEQMAEDHRRDPLTKIGNRQRMQEDLDHLAARALRYGHQFCIALCDIDSFKSYNDACGTAAGDDALKAIARTLTRFSRSGDTVYRVAGQQFLIVLPAQTLDGGLIALERRRRAVERLQMPHPGRAAHGVVTLSAGLVDFDPQNRNALETALEHAERALRWAKENGRNRVATYRQVEDAPRVSTPAQDWP